MFTIKEHTEAERKEMERRGIGGGSWDALKWKELSNGKRYIENISTYPEQM